MKQTAVEWLEEKFNNNNAQFINWSEDYFYEAKEMEKQQCYSEEDVIALLEYVRKNFYDTGLKWHSQPNTDYTSKEVLNKFKNNNI